MVFIEKYVLSKVHIGTLRVYLLCLQNIYRILFLRANGFYFRAINFNRGFLVFTEKKINIRKRNYLKNLTKTKEQPKTN